MLGVRDRVLELRGQACSGPSPSDTPWCQACSFWPPGSLTRTVLSTMANKENLFAAFGEWDSASYRPHSWVFHTVESGLRGVGKVAPAVGRIPVLAPGQGICAAATAAASVVLVSQELVQMEPGWRLFNRNKCLLNCWTVEKRGCFLLTASRVGMALFIGSGSQANVLCSFSLLADLQMTC